MERTLLLLLYVFFISSLIEAQENKSDLNKLFTIELGLHGLGVGYEIPFTNKF